MYLKVNKHYIWIYFIIFFSLWCMRELWLVQYLELMDTVPKTITSAVIKVGIWIIPVFLLVIFVEKVDALDYLGLRYHFKTGLNWAGWVSLIFIAYFTILNFIFLHNRINFQISFDEWLNTILLVGITEEIVFRGFILKKLTGFYKFWIANTITSFLFIIIHFPIWFYKGLFEFSYIYNASLTTFILSIIFGYVYKKSGSLWSVIVIHSLYDALVSIFY